mgnify:FL=1
MPHTEEMSIAEYRALAGRSKYGNKKVEIDGYTFDSLAESRRYEELCLLEIAGEIKDLFMQPRYELQKPFTDNTGKRHRAIFYIGDFYYVEVKTGLRIVEDVKGKATPAFLIKQKLFLYKRDDLYLRIIK